MLRVRKAMCNPSLSDQIAAMAATSPLRKSSGCVKGSKAARKPTRPSPNVQVVSIQPEFFVSRQISHAPLIATESAAERPTRPRMNARTVKLASQANEGLQQHSDPATQLELALQRDQA